MCRKHALGLGMGAGIESSTEGDENARQCDEDGTGKLCTVGVAVAVASVFEWCLFQLQCSPLPHSHNEALAGGCGVQKWDLCPHVALEGSGTTSSRCQWSLFQWAELENSIKTAQWVRPSHLEVSLHHKSLARPSNLDNYSETEWNMLPGLSTESPIKSVSNKIYR